jgi:hypothetical protein
MTWESDTAHWGNWDEAVVVLCASLRRALPLPWPFRFFWFNTVNCIFSTASHQMVIYMMNWEGCKVKRSWPISGYWNTIWLEGLNTSIRIPGFWPESWRWGVSNKKQEYQPRYRDILSWCFPSVGQSGKGKFMTMSLNKTISHACQWMDLNNWTELEHALKETSDRGHLGFGTVQWCGRITMTAVVRSSEMLIPYHNTTQR